jgi:DNA/RNA endonuclease YhcR with UshA esterase domain
MLMKTRRRIFCSSGTLLLAAIGLLVLTTSASVVAHHAFGAEFDPNRPVLLRGPVVKVEWVNPHAWIHVEVTNDDGTSEVWMVEGGTPNTLLRRGLSRDSIVPGMVIIVDGYQSKDRTARANGRDVTFEDGSKFFMGSSGTGAPQDGRDPTER